MKYEAGQQFENGGVHYRIRDGKNCEGDLTMEIALSPNGPWLMIPVAHSLILVTFKAQVEEHNYGPNGKVERGKAGKFYLWRALQEAFNTGDWEFIAERIAKERHNKRGWRAGEAK